VQLLAAIVEAGLTSYGGHHTPHSGRTLGPGHIQFLVARTLSLMAVLTQVVGAVVDHGAQHGQYLFAARFVVSRLLAAATGDLVVMRYRHAQQPLHGHCPGVVHRVPHQHLDGFQIDRAGLMPIGGTSLH
jgi:hypothetical protein